MKEVYKVETHAHTKEVSPCGWLDGETLMQLYAEKGYSTVIITDHFYSSLINKTKLEWKEAWRTCKKGYESAKKAGEKYGICVLCGFELRLNTCTNDYLIYGLPDVFFDENPGIFDLKPNEMYDVVHRGGGFVVQAHPTRMPSATPTPECVDALEVHNTHPRHADHTDFELANTIATEYGLLKTGGSDAHRTEDVGLGGMAFPFPVTSVFEYIQGVKEGAGQIL